MSVGKHDQLCVRGAVNDRARDYFALARAIQQKLD